MPNMLPDKMENEVRYDKFTNRLVIVAKGRRKRPRFYHGDSEEESKECPFCPGHEKETPKAILLYVLEKRKGILKTSDEEEYRRSDWSVRVFPNMYPALNTEATLFDSGSYSYGYHEVVVENPNHFWRYEQAEPRSIELSLLALIDRGRFMESDSRVKHVAIFKNQGREAGASIAHPHYQIIGSSFIPPLALKEVESFLSFTRDGGRCYFCTLPNEARNGGRLIFSKDHFSAITPFASIFPYECWVVPRHHVGSFLESGNEEVRDLAITLRDLFFAYKSVLGSFPFNIVFHSKPVENMDFHWHIEIYPRIAIHAGFELGSGAFINVIGPEEAALQLRQALPISDHV